MYFNPYAVLARHHIFPCSPECVDGVDKGVYADESVWHHTECPNHTTACCSANDKELING